MRFACLGQEAVDECEIVGAFSGLNQFPAQRRDDSVEAHDVGAKGEVWPGGAEERGDFFGIVPWAVAAMHAAKHGIRAGLQWKMGMASQARSAVFGHESDEVGIPIHWLDGTQSETREVGLAEDLAHQRGKREAGLAELVEIAAPAAKIDSGKHQFVATSRDKASDMDCPSGHVFVPWGQKSPLPLPWLGVWRLSA